ncbi:hypothetical protein ACHAPU_002861 [Fusarium lateritium]
MPGSSSLDWVKILFRLLQTSSIGAYLAFSIPRLLVPNELPYIHYAAGFVVAFESVLLLVYATITEHVPGLESFNLPSIFALLNFRGFVLWSGIAFMEFQADSTFPEGQGLIFARLMFASAVFASVMGAILAFCHMGTTAPSEESKKEEEGIPLNNALPEPEEPPPPTESLYARGGRSRGGPPSRDPRRFSRYEDLPGDDE